MFRGSLAQTKTAKIPDVKVNITHQIRKIGTIYLGVRSKHKLARTLIIMLRLRNQILRTKHSTTEDSEYHT